MLRLSLIASLILVAFSGCALKEPLDAAQMITDNNITIPKQWEQSTTTHALPSQSWIKEFNDPQLEALINETLKHNLDLRIAASRVNQASAYVTMAGGALVPSVNAIAGVSTKYNNNGGSAFDGWGLNASWEADIWGRVRYEARSAESTYASVQADREFARHSIASLVAKGWFAATEASLQQHYLDASIIEAKKLITLAQQRSSIGAGSQYDVIQAKSTVENLNDQRQQVHYALTNALRCLEVLMGRYPNVTLSPNTQFSPLPPLPNSGIPSELLERRADIISSRYRLLAAYDKANEAGAARLPQITLKASISDFSSSVFVLQNSGLAAGLGAGLSAPIFNNGALKAQEELKIAQQHEALLQYEKTVYNAFYEVENTLSLEKTLHDREMIAQSLVEQSKQSATIEASRYSIGSKDMRALANAQLVVLQKEIALLRVQSEQRIVRANLYLALGGSL